MTSFTALLSSLFMTVNRVNGTSPVPEAPVEGKSGLISMIYRCLYVRYPFNYMRLYNDQSRSGAEHCIEPNKGYSL